MAIFSFSHERKKQKKLDVKEKGDIMGQKREENTIDRIRLFSKKMRVETYRISQFKYADLYWQFRWIQINVYDIIKASRLRDK